MERYVSCFVHLPCKSRSSLNFTSWSESVAESRDQVVLDWVGHSVPESTADEWNCVAKTESYSANIFPVIPQSHCSHRATWMPAPDSQTRTWHQSDALRRSWFYGFIMFCHLNLKTFFALFMPFECYADPQNPCLTKQHPIPWEGLIKRHGQLYVFFLRKFTWKDLLFWHQICAAWSALAAWSAWLLNGFVKSRSTISA